MLDRRSIELKKAKRAWDEVYERVEAEIKAVEEMPDPPDPREVAYNEAMARLRGLQKSLTKRYEANEWAVGPALREVGAAIRQLAFDYAQDKALAFPVIPEPPPLERLVFTALEWTTWSDSRLFRRAINPIGPDWLQRLVIRIYPPSLQEGARLEARGYWDEERRLTREMVEEGYAQLRIFGHGDAGINITLNGVDLDVPIKQFASIQPANGLPLDKATTQRILGTTEWLSEQVEVVGS